MDCHTQSLEDLWKKLAPSSYYYVYIISFPVPVSQRATHSYCALSLPVPALVPAPNLIPIPPTPQQYHTGAAQPNDVPADESNAFAMDNPDPQIPNPAVAKAAILNTKFAHLKRSMRGVPPVSPYTNKSATGHHSYREVDGRREKRKGKERKALTRFHLVQSLHVSIRCRAPEPGTYSPSPSAAWSWRR
jgi:hypothetical protein